MSSIGNGIANKIPFGGSAFVYEGHITGGSIEGPLYSTRRLL